MTAVIARLQATLEGCYTVERKLLPVPALDADPKKRSHDPQPVVSTPLEERDQCLLG
jgi:hypothetical protein